MATSAAAAQAPKPVIVVDTSMGTTKLGLHADKAPFTVKNLFNYVEDRFYDNTLFHRVHRDFHIQGGGHGAGLKEKTTRPPNNDSTSGRPKVLAR